MKNIEDKEGIEFKMKTKENLRILLQSKESCLHIEDILPLLHKKTKMREIKIYLAQRVKNKIEDINFSKKDIEEQSKEIQKLHESKKKKGKSHILVDPSQKCDLCQQTIFSEEFYVFSCKHSLHRFCIVRLFQSYE